QRAGGGVDVVLRLPECGLHGLVVAVEGDSALLAVDVRHGLHQGVIDGGRVADDGDGADPGRVDDRVQVDLDLVERSGVRRSDNGDGAPVREGEDLRLQPGRGSGGGQHPQLGGGQTGCDLHEGVVALLAAVVQAE